MFFFYRRAVRIAARVSFKNPISVDAKRGESVIPAAFPHRITNPPTRDVKLYKEFEKLDARQFGF